jgi:stage V sporulation protein G|tara:strand:+ start:487 stop:897 length:411 start_codon:yes stop_codon:yes gene_type:complete
MFSYSISVRRINNQNSKLKAFATVTIDDILDLEGFKIIDGSKGLFVSVPSHKGNVMEDGISVEKYFDDIRFKGEEGIAFAEELKAAIINEYTKSSSTNTSKPNRAAAATANVKANSKVTDSSDSAPPRDRKPLWGY